MRSEGYSTWFVSVSVLPSVCYHVFCDYAHRDNKIAIPTGSSLHWLHFKKGDFRITAAFKSYDVKSKPRLTSTASARSVYLAGTRSHNEGHVSTPACYLLLCLARVRLSPSY